MCLWTTEVNISGGWMVNSNNTNRVAGFRGRKKRRQSYNADLSRPYPQRTMRWLSGDQSRSLMAPPSAGYSAFRICSWLTVSQIRTFPEISENHRSIVVLYIKKLLKNNPQKHVHKWSTHINFSNVYKNYIYMETLHLVSLNHFSCTFSLSLSLSLSLSIYIYIYVTALSTTPLIKTNKPTFHIIS